MSHALTTVNYHFVLSFHIINLLSIVNHSKRSHKMKHCWFKKEVENTENLANLQLMKLSNLVSFLHREYSCAELRFY